MGSPLKPCNFDRPADRPGGTGYKMEISTAHDLEEAYLALKRVKHRAHRERAYLKEQVKPKISLAKMSWDK